MDKRIIITESEKSRIKELHLLNEGFLGKLLDRVKGSNIYRKVEKAYDPNPQTFVQNIIRELPKLEKVKDELIKRINNVDKMSTEEKTKELERTQGELEKNLKQVQSELGEQTDLASATIRTGGPALGGVGTIFLLLIVVVGIYMIIGISKEEKLKRQDPEQYAELKGLKTDRDKEFEDKLKVLHGKKINLYKDEGQTELESNSKIVNLDLVGKNFRTGDVPHVAITFPVFRKGLFTELAYFRVNCRFNPTKFDDKIIVKPDVTESLSNKNEIYLYNKQFTDKLSEIASAWCKKPEADFGSVDKGDVSNLA